jgi:hypothetical protein
MYWRSKMHLPPQTSDLVPEAVVIKVTVVVEEVTVVVEEVVVLVEVEEIEIIAVIAIAVIVVPPTMIVEEGVDVYLRLLAARVARWALPQR